MTTSPTHMKALGGYSPVITLDRRDKAPLHAQLYNAFREGILAGRLATGQQVPSTRALSQELGISRVPVLEAYSQLIAEGYFETRKGAGTFISCSLPEDAPVSPAGRPVDPGARTLSRRSGLAVSLKHEPWLGKGGAFSVGQLVYDHFPAEAFAQLVAKHARKAGPSSMNYGKTIGDPAFRNVIAQYLRTARAVNCDPDQILVLSGSQQALGLCIHVLTDPGDSVWMEEPGYPTLRQILGIAGVRAVPIRVDKRGLDVAAGIQKSPLARAAFVTPSHQFPLGAIMSASRRLQLLDWVHSSNAWIVEDDYDSEYRYQSMPIASLQGLDHGSRVIYIGTFSKVLFPSLRIGYMVVPADLVDRFAAVRRTFDICPPHLPQAVLTDFIEQGHYARHIRRNRLLYSERRTALVESLEQAFGNDVQIHGAAAGTHLVITLQHDIDDIALSTEAAQSKLWLWPLSSTYAGKSRRSGFILGFGSTDLREIAKGVAKLEGLVHAHAR